MTDKQPLLFLPNLLCDERLWRDQAHDLADIAKPTIADLNLDSLAGMAARLLAARARTIAFQRPTGAMQ